MMPRTLRWIVSLAAVWAAVACGDAASTEPPVTTAAAASSSRAAGDVVKLLKRDDALRAMTASAVIGPNGGHLEIQDAGIRIDFAPGALPVPTRITVTSLRGRNVAYRFEPHGLAFQAPVVIRQSLRNTTAWKNSALAADLQGSYFDRLVVDPTETYTRTSERRAAKLRESGKLLEFTIEHFSGYLTSSGKSSVDIDIGVDITGR